MTDEEFFKMNYFLQEAFSMRSKTNCSCIQISFSKEQEKANNVAIKSEIFISVSKGEHINFSCQNELLFSEQSQE